MAIDIRQESAEALPVYATISAEFWISSRLHVDRTDAAGFNLSEQPVDPPHLKDYDALGESPLTWRQQWDLSNWGIFIAREAGEPVGGAAIAWRTPEFQMLEGRDDLAVLWDLRVKTKRRRHGTGQLLFHHAAAWAKERQCTTLKIETQNNNVSACRFYQAAGCRLGSARPGAYPELPDEIMFLWYFDLIKPNHPPQPRL